MGIHPADCRCGNCARRLCGNHCALTKRSFPLHFYAVLAALIPIFGCAPKPVSDAPPPQVPALNAAWNAALETAKRDPAYAGSYVTRKTLWIGFTYDAESKLAAIATQPDIRAYAAQHSAIELERAFKSTVEFLTVSRFGPTSVNIDYRRSAVTVGTAYSLQDSGDIIPKCPVLPAIPATAPETNVRLVDGRDCRK
jgi:hypothetical protein